MAASESKREAIEVAARPLRDLLREEHDEIAAAQRALRQAERVHDRAIELARRQLRAARTAEPLASYGHEVILYADRLSTADGNHELTPEVRARVETRAEAGRFPRHEMVLVLETPTWRREVMFPRRDQRKVRRLAEDIEAAARNAQAIRGAARAEVEQAERDLGGAQADRHAIEETRALIHRLSDLVHDDEDVIDMAPGISAGHDGVLVATDQRLLFISVRRTLRFPYEEVSGVDVKGKWFGARLSLSTSSGKGVISGIAPRHAADIADLVRSRIADETATV
jgi:hypothetical protein